MSTRRSKCHIYRLSATTFAPSARVWVLWVMHLCECKDWTVVVGACVQGPVFGQCNTVHAGRRLVLTYVEQEWWAKLVIEEEQKSKGTCSSDRAANSNF